MGLTAKSFHTLGVDVTVVEIDPVVHRFAEEYFRLPRLNVRHDDGRRFVETSVLEGREWDYIIQDVFTGGSGPTHLYTVEMWASVKSVLAEHGVLAVVCCLHFLTNTEPRWFNR